MLLNALEQPRAAAAGAQVLPQPVQLQPQACGRAQRADLLDRRRVDDIKVKDGLLVDVVQQLRRKVGDAEAAKVPVVQDAPWDDARLARVAAGAKVFAEVFTVAEFLPVAGPTKAMDAEDVRRRGMGGGRTKWHAVQSRPWPRPRPWPRSHLGIIKLDAYPAAGAAVALLLDGLALAAWFCVHREDDLISRRRPLVVPAKASANLARTGGEGGMS